MSVSTTCSVFCDHPGCGRWADEALVAGSPSEARAKATGWARERWAGRSYDLCHDHKGQDPRRAADGPL